MANRKIKSLCVLGITMIFIVETCLLAQYWPSEAENNCVLGRNDAQTKTSTLNFHIVTMINLMVFAVTLALEDLSIIQDISLLWFMYFIWLVFTIIPYGLNAGCNETLFPKTVLQWPLFIFAWIQLPGWLIAYFYFVWRKETKSPHEALVANVVAAEE